MKTKVKKELAAPLIEFESILYIIKDKNSILSYAHLESRINEKENSIIFKLNDKSFEKNSKLNMFLNSTKGKIKNSKAFELKIKLPVFIVDNKNLLDKDNEWNTEFILKRMTELVLLRKDLDKYIDDTIYLCSSKI